MLDVVVVDDGDGDDSDMMLMSMNLVNQFKYFLFQLFFLAIKKNMNTFFFLG